MRKVYQNTLVGSEFAVLEKELRQTINGIYASSDDPEIQRLINYINENKFKKSKQAEVDRSIQTLQSKFARDRAGENMKRYAGQILNDSLRDFDATLNFNKSQDAGLTFVKYYGDVIPTTREICRRLVNGVIKSKEEMDFSQLMKSINYGQRSWSGKKKLETLLLFVVVIIVVINGLTSILIGMTIARRTNNIGETMSEENKQMLLKQTVETKRRKTRTTKATEQNVYTRTIR